MTDIKAATVLTDEVRAAMKRAYNLGQTYWQQADSEYTSQHKKADLTAGRFIELTDEICSKVERLLAQAGVTAEPAGWKLVPIKLTPEMRAAWDKAPQNEDDDIEFAGAYQAMIDAAPTIRAQVPAAEVRAQAMDTSSALDTLWQRVTDAREAAYTFGDNCKEAVEIALDGVLDMLVEADLAHQSTADKASEVRAASDTELLDLLDAWVERNKAAGYHHFVFAFDTSSTAREQIAADEVLRTPSTADSANTGALGDTGGDRG